MKILSLDTGKFKTVWLNYVSEGDVRTFGKTVTAPKEISELLDVHKPDLLLLESGPDAGWMCDIAWEKKIEVKVANTNDERWQWKNRKKKRDREDAERMLEMAILKTLPTIHVPKPDVRQWRSLIAYRHELVDRRTAVKNSIRSIFVRQGIRLPSGHHAWTEAAIADLRKDALSADACPQAQLWRFQIEQELAQLDALEKSIETVEKKLDEIAAKDDRIKLLKTAPCVGPRLSELVVATLDDPHRFKNGRQVGSYAGLAPRIWQSGEMSIEGHISRMGNPILREVLVEVSWLGIRTNPWMKRVYENVRRGSDKRKKIAIVAVARQLFVRLWAMLRDGTPWKEPDLVTPTVTGEVTDQGAVS